LGKDEKSANKQEDNDKGDKPPEFLLPEKSKQVFDNSKSQEGVSDTLHTISA
jgi:hypothetical protein